MGLTRSVSPRPAVHCLCAHAEASEVAVRQEILSWGATQLVAHKMDQVRSDGPVPVRRGRSAQARELPGGPVRTPTCLRSHGESACVGVPSPSELWSAKGPEVVRPRRLQCPLVFRHRPSFFAAPRHHPGSWRGRSSPIPPCSPASPLLWCPFPSVPPPRPPPPQGPPAPPPPILATRGHLRASCSRSWSN